MAEYIEREALLKFIQDGLNNPDKARAFGHDAVEIMAEVQCAPAADVVAVVHGEDSVLAEFEEVYKDFNKIKTHLAQIIVSGKVEKPYYSILWWDEESKEYNIGYSSFCLDYVRKWLSLAFEIVGAADVVEVVRCRDCKHGEIDDPDFPDLHYCHEGCGWNPSDFFCAGGKRRESE